MAVLFAVDRNLMRMYVILAIAALLFLTCLIVLADRAVKNRRQLSEARKREEIAARLAAVVEQAAQEEQARASAAEALTTVLPAIQAPQRGPRRVA